jgi:hypothetical protein
MSIFQFLPLVVVLCLYAAYVRLAARMTRLLGVGWLRAFQFAALVMVLSMLGRAVTLYVGQAPLVAAGLFGIAVHLWLGGWFFKGRAMATDGQPAGWGGGAKLAGVALALLLATIFVLFGVVRALLPTMQP